MEDCQNQGCQNVLATGAIMLATLRFLPAVNCWGKAKIED